MKISYIRSIHTVFVQEAYLEKCPRLRHVITLYPLIDSKRKWKVKRHKSGAICRYFFCIVKLKFINDWAMQEHSQPRMKYDQGQSKECINKVVTSVLTKTTFKLWVLGCFVLKTTQSSIFPKSFNMKYNMLVYCDLTDYMAHSTYKGIYPFHNSPMQKFLK